MNDLRELILRHTNVDLYNILKQLHLTNCNSSQPLLSYLYWVRDSGNYIYIVKDKAEIDSLITAIEVRERKNSD